MNEILNNARIFATQTSSPEPKVLEENSAALEMWQDIQNLRMKMNEEIIQAVTKITQHYQSQIDVLESEYGMYLQMITPHKQDA
jgi:hypothetical protein